MRKLSLILIVLMFAFAGCKKDKNVQDAIDNKLILDYIQANNLTAIATGSGLYYVVTAPGDSTRPVNNATLPSTVYVKYHGYLLDGTQFDSSYELSEQPAQFSMAGIIKGFAEGLSHFGKGGKGKLIIPSTLGYGSVADAKIPANSVLIFDFELVNFQ